MTTDQEITTSAGLAVTAVLGRGGLAPWRVLVPGLVAVYAVSGAVMGVRRPRGG